MNNENSKKHAGAADHLANERTFLAWIRTSIALMGFGFVIVKFVVFIRQMSFIMGGKEVTGAGGYSDKIGVIMVLLGAVITVLAYLRYRNIEKQLNHNSYYPSKWLSVLVMLSIIISSFFLILYLLPNLQ